MRGRSKKRGQLPAGGAADPPLLAEAALLVEAAVAEDVGAGDVTTRVCPPARRTGAARIVARADGVLAGLWIVQMVYRRLDRAVWVERRAADGARVRAGQTVALVRGPLAAILTGERIALNFVQRLSGVATLTRAFVRAVRGTGAVICDTRKTTPGWRRLEKYAVRCGGGTNHRLGLYDEVLIKDNHLALARRPLADVVREARRRVGPKMKIEVEVETLDQLREVLSLLPAQPARTGRSLGAGGVDYILLDNMPRDRLRRAVRMREAVRPGGPPFLEASGGVTLRNVRAIARTGVDRISVGALTHSAPALDLALDVCTV